MPKLPRVSGHEAIKAFTRLGYRELRQRGSHVRLVHPEPNLRYHLSIPLHKELGVGLLRKLIRDAHMTVQEFKNLLK